MEEQCASLEVKLGAAEDELNAERQAAAEVLERVRAEEAAKAAQAVALAKAEAAELVKKLAAAELKAAQVKAAFAKVAAQAVERRLKDIEDQRLRHEADLVAMRADERRRAHHGVRHGGAAGVADSAHLSCVQGWAPSVRGWTGSHQLCTGVSAAERLSNGRVTAR